MNNEIANGLRRCALVCWLALWCGAASNARADELPVSTGTSAGGTSQFPGPVVVLTWPDAASNGWPGVVQYTLYRKAGATDSWPQSATPIVRQADAAGLKGLFDADLCAAVTKALAARSSYAPYPPLDPWGNAALSLAAVTRASAQWDLLQALARSKWQVAVAIAQGYRDTAVHVGNTYYYQLRGLDANGEQVLTPQDIVVTVGAPPTIPAPPNVTAQAGDSRVLITWGDSPPGLTTNAGYYVYRSDAGGSFQGINASGLTTQVAKDVYGNPFPSPMNGLMDIQHWDASGLPVSHTENSIAINGPRNGVSYSYRVCAMDLLGTPSSQLSAPTPGVIPMDSTPPQAPGGNPPQGFVTVTTPSDLGLSSSPCSPPPPLATIVIRWNRVGLDVQGHREQGSFTKYRVYRFPNANNPTDGAAQLCEINDSPANPVPLSWSDQVPRAIYGETSYWYRVNAKTRLAT